MSNSDPTLFERLAKVEPAKLARLLVELAAQDQTILEQVQFLLASGDTTAIAKRLQVQPKSCLRKSRNHFRPGGGKPSGVTISAMTT